MKTIKISDDIKLSIAERVSTQASAGYSKGAQGEWFVVDGSSVVHAQQNRPWDPWSDGARVISVEDLVFEFGGAEQDRADFENDGSKLDYELTVEFALGYVPSEYDADAYEARYE